jgi:hypothetical protein
MKTGRSRKGKTPSVSAANDPLQEEDLGAEIRSLRTQARRVADLAREEDGLKEAIQALNALGTAFIRLAHLLESRKKLSGGRSEFEKALEQVLAKINQADEEKRQTRMRKGAPESKPEVGRKAAEGSQPQGRGFIRKTDKTTSETNTQ